MGKTHTANDDDCVDNITSGVESCRIAENGSTVHELTGGLEKLSLARDKEDTGKAEKQSEAQKKDNENGESDKKDDTEKKEEEEAAECRLVRLKPPSFETTGETSDSEDEAESNTAEAGALRDRGPMHGVPSNYEVESGHAYITNKSYTPYQQAAHLSNISGGFCNTLPPNFPNYQNYSPAMHGDQGRHTKRGRDEREVYHEPPKYVRPQNAPVMNDLNAPGRKISSVFKKQMSGGTMYAPDNMPTSAEQIMNGMVAASGGYDDGQQQDSYQQNGGMLDRQDSMGIQDIWLAGMNIPVDLDVEDFLPDDDTTAPGDGNYQMVAQTTNAVQARQPQKQQQQNQQGGPLPPVSALTNLVPSNYQQQFPQGQQYNYPQYQLPHQTSQDSRNSGKRGSINSQEDVGYNSDLSPTHDPQFPPTPSPHSTMEASPGPSTSLRWSPPPSNMSEDSGICSPMPDDQNGYTSQVKSPRQGYGKPGGNNSPYHTGVLGSSPPQQLMMSPPQHATSPSHIGMSPLHEPASVGPVPDTSEAGHQQQLYVSNYIDQHLEDLHNALEVASEDLKKETLKKSMPNVARPQGSPPGISSAISGVDNLALNRGSPPAMPQMPGLQPQSIGVNSTKVGPVMNEMPPNLPTTVPATISPGHNPSASAGKSAKNEVPKTQPIATVIITNGMTTMTQPPVNSAGKLPIPPLPRQTKQGPVFPTSVLIVTPSHPQGVQPQRKYQPIAPKDPAKQGDKSGDGKGKSPSAGNSRSGAPCEPGRPGGEGPAPNAGKKPAASNTTLLNLARRLVAEMSTSDLKYKDPDGDTYLHVAVCKADHFMVQALLERLQREKLTEMIDIQNSMGQTPLYLAVSTSHAKMVQLLVSANADVNPFAERQLPSGAYEKSAAIHCACSKGSKNPRYLDTLKALLKAPDINLNQVNSEGHTALHCAILAHNKPEADGSHLNSIPIIQALIPAGADPNLQVQQSGKTALMYALESRDIDLVESIFQLVEPSKLPAFLKTQAFDGVSCLRIAESLKASLDATSQQRLITCLKPRPTR